MAIVAYKYVIGGIIMSKTNSLEGLVKKFHVNMNFYKNAANGYNEHSCRIEYIDVFLELLGWDVSNKGDTLPQFREVKAENYASLHDRPDYSITLNGIVKFFIEAKKPLVNISVEPDSAYQARKYGWNAKHDVSVLTNFEYLLIYDTTILPVECDGVNVGLLKKYHYTEYIDKFDEISLYLSRNTVYSGIFQSNISSLIGNLPGLHIKVDNYFLEQINEWRVDLGNHLLHNKSYSVEIINDLVQDFINQIIFLRICEDKNLPLYHKLYETIEDNNTIKDELNRLFEAADKRYNSGLFKGEYIIFDLDSDIIKKIVKKLYYPASPYVFGLIDPNILGQIYEMFLAEHLIIKNKAIILQKKKENINRDIVTTPIEIVRMMVSKGLGQLVVGKTPDEIKLLRIADIACGSGIFLLETVDFIYNYCIAWYLRNECRDFLTQAENGEYKLLLSEKKEILQSCFYGIDIDVHAVEVTKFSLLLKLLEGETEPSVVSEQPILPELTSNIVHGNSLIDEEIAVRLNLSMNEKMEIVPFCWENINNREGFDLIIGNPPYVTTGDMKNILPSKEFVAYKSEYETPYMQFDKYMVFLERAYKKVKEDGYVCYIIPNKFMKIKAGTKLRKFLSENKCVVEITDFGSLQLFEDKTIYSSIILLHKKEYSDFRFEEVENIDIWLNHANEKKVELTSNRLTESPWILISDNYKRKTIDRLLCNSIPLSTIVDISNGIQTSAERPPVYWFSMSEVSADMGDSFEILKFGKKYIIEKAILKPYFKPVLKAEKNLGTYDVPVTNKFIIFPYDCDGKLYAIDIMKTRFMNTYEYLMDRYDLLEPKQIANKSTGRDVENSTEDTWYQYGRSQSFKLFWNIPKLIAAVLRKDKPMYIYDKNDFVIASGGTAGYVALTGKKDSNYCLEYIQAYLNHPETGYIFSVIGSDFEGGFHAVGTYVLKNLPIKALDFANKQHAGIYRDVVKFTRDIYEINTQLAATSVTKHIATTLNSEKKRFIKEIERLISEVYRL